MRLFKKTFLDRTTHERRESTRFYVEFRDHQHRRQRWPAFPDQRRSHSLGERLERMVLIRGGGAEMDPDTARWLETMSRKLRDRCVKIGLLDLKRLAIGKPLLVHLDGEKDAAGNVTAPGFAQSLKAKGNRQDYSELVAGRVRRLIEDCGFVTWSDISAERVEQYLAEQRATASLTEKQQCVAAGVLRAVPRVTVEA